MGVVGYLRGAGRCVHSDIPIPGPGPGGRVLIRLAYAEGKERWGVLSAGI